MTVPLLLTLLLQTSPCDAAPGDPAGSPDLYCLRLTPTVEAGGATATVELRLPPGPFTLPVTPDGHVRYQPVLRAADLPDPATLGPWDRFVAWVAPPLMVSMRRLGTVSEGVTVLPEVTLDKFVILVTAERRDGAEREGPLVFRGASPSTRMRSPDFLEFMLGAVREGGGHEAHGASAPAADGVAWTTVPMPRGLSMLPALMALRPGVRAWLPRPIQPVAPARPRELIRLTDGDTLRLAAEHVTRTIHGRTFTMYGFNGQYPGPLLQVPRHATVIVEFTNRIERPTTVHWHGLRLENRFDGVPEVTQAPVRPGETFTYRLRFPDAGIYWYHPHVREDAQQDLGLYGNMLVRAPEEDWYGRVNHEEVLMLDDLLIGPDGLVPYADSAATHAFMGRFGNVFLVNGEPAWRTTVRRGEVVRFYLTNVSNTRTMNLSFPGALIKIVGSDVGNYVQERWVESVVIAPAERYVVHVRFDESGTVPLVNRVRAIDHLYGRFFGESDTLGVIRVDSARAEPDLREAFEHLGENPYAVEDIAPYRGDFDRPVDRELVLTLAVRDIPLVTQRLMQLDSAYFHPVEWSGTMPMMNWSSTTQQVRWILRDPAAGEENMDITGWRFRVGDRIKLRLRNARESVHAMPHPIHIHGQRFLVLSVNGVPNEDLVWKDTVLLPVGATADILLELSNPGRWMLHCHIAEHIEAGMMMVFEVGGEP